MSIFYTLVTSREKIISENTEYVGNFEQISREIVRKIKEDTRGCIDYDQTYKFYFINNSGISFLCMTDKSYDKTNAFLFLEKIADLLSKTFTEKEIENSVSYGLDSKFKPLINNAMVYA